MMTLDEFRRDVQTRLQSTEYAVINAQHALTVNALDWNKIDALTKARRERDEALADAECLIDHGLW